MTSADWEAEAFALCQRILYQHLDTSQYGVFLFGSRARGTARRNSDIDIGIIGKQPLPWLLIEDIQEIMEESDLLYEVDLVDFSQLNDPAFKRFALNNIVWWNQPAGISVSNLLNLPGQ